MHDIHAVGIQAPESAVSEVVVVRADDDRLTRQISASGKDTDHVAHVGSSQSGMSRSGCGRIDREPLQESERVARPEASFFESAGDVRGGGVETGGADTPALECVRSEEFDIGRDAISRAGACLPDRRDGGAERKRDRDDRHGTRVCVNYHDSVRSLRWPEFN